MTGRAQSNENCEYLSVRFSRDVHARYKEWARQSNVSIRVVHDAVFRTYRPQFNTDIGVPEEHQIISVAVPKLVLEDIEERRPPHMSPGTCVRQWLTEGIDNYPTN
ncbi:MAG: hypothetical protein AAF417_15085 [Pseudomonadota bacterium]